MAVGRGASFDCFFADTTISSAREAYVDFSVPYFYDTLRMCTLAGTATPVEFLNFLTPLSSQVWISYVGAIIVCGILYCMFEAGSNEELSALGGDHPVKILGVSTWVHHQHSSRGLKVTTRSPAMHAGGTFYRAFSAATPVSCQ